MMGPRHSATAPSRSRLAMGAGGMHAGGTVADGIGAGGKDAGGKDAGGMETLTFLSLA